MLLNHAILLEDAAPSGDVKRISSLLAFFGLSNETLTVADFFAGIAAYANNGASRQYRIICSAQVFVEVLGMQKCNSSGLAAWKKVVHSVFVFQGREPEALVEVARVVTQAGHVEVLPLDHPSGYLTISADMDDFCGVLGGIRISMAQTDCTSSLALSSPCHPVTPIVSGPTGALFVKADCDGIPIFLSTLGEIIDVTAPVSGKNFDVRKHFMAAVPIVLYAKWAFKTERWQSPAPSACLIIDDPLLRHTYGCVDFSQLFGLMDRHAFSINIAFISWNWNRSDSDVVRLFKSRPERSSISIHGCDHTWREFECTDDGILSFKVQQAVERMDRHEAATGLSYDRVMVFPQGVFSASAVAALKHKNFLAAVNTGVLSADLNPREIKVAAFWDVAVMDYANFPIFTRRYPSDGIENFAFDIFLGKPCIIVIHHDFCQQEKRRLIEFVAGLNQLRIKLSWKPLAEVLKCSYRWRERSSGHIDIEMYGNQLQIGNPNKCPTRFSMRKRESQLSCVRSVTVDSVETAWHCVDGYLQWDVNMEPLGRSTVAVTYHDVPRNVFYRDGFVTRTQTALRRYLSEARANYLRPGRLFR